MWPRQCVTFSGRCFRAYLEPKRNQKLCRSIAGSCKHTLKLRAATAVPGELACGLNWPARLDETRVARQM
jgi:hypothetical protein